MKLPGVTRIREPIINGHRLYKELCIDSDFIPECALLWASGTYTQLAIESYNNAFKLSNLDFLKDFGEVSRVRVTMDRKIDLGGLYALASSLGHLQINDAINTLSDFRPLEDIKSLSIKWDAKTVFPAVMPRLEFLGVSHVLFPKDGSWPLPNAPLLTSFGITQSRNVTTLSGIETYRKLRDLSIAYCPNLVNIDAIGELSALESLELQGTKKVLSYAALKKLAELTKISFDKSGPIESFHLFEGMKNLKRLVIKGTEIVDLDTSPLLSLPSLIHVHLDKKKEHEVDYKKLKSLVSARKEDALND